MAVDELQRDLDALLGQIKALRFLVNPSTGVADNQVGIERDASSNLVFFDAVTGFKTLAEVISGGGGSAPSRTITGTVTVSANTVQVNHDITVNNSAALVIESGAALILV